MKGEFPGITCFIQEGQVGLTITPTDGGKGSRAVTHTICNNLIPFMTLPPQWACSFLPPNMFYQNRIESENKH